jgi:hypothetical protein
LFLPLARRNVRKNSYVSRIVTIWNDLSESVVSAATLASFERLLDRAWADQPVKWDFRADYRKPYELHKESSNGL